MLVLSSSPVLAVGSDLSLGLGVGFAPDYEGSDEYEVVPVILARAGSGGRSVELRGTTLKATLLTNGVFSVGRVVNYRGERANVDEDAVDDLDDVDAAIELGGFVSFFHQGLLANVTALQDVADAHDGYLIEAQLG